MTLAKRGRSLPIRVSRTLMMMVLSVLVDRVRACPLEIWTFDSLEHCSSISQSAGALQPRSKGRIQADGTCRTTEILSTTPDSQNDFSPNLPGTYNAVCRPGDDANTFGSIAMWESGCRDANCAVAAPGDTTCARDLTGTAALYSRSTPPGIHTVQDPSLRETGYFDCFIIYGGGPATGLDVTFAIFGDCGSCVASPTESPSTGASPTAEPTTPPTAEPTLPPTRNPTNTPTQNPTGTPTTQSPTMAEVPVPTTATPPATTTTTSTAVPPTTTTTVQSPTVTVTTPAATPEETHVPSLRGTTSPTLAPTTVRDRNDPDQLSTGDARDTSSSSNSTVTMVAGGAAGGALLIIALATVIWFIFIFKRRQKASTVPKTASQDQTTPQSHGAQSNNHSDNNFNQQRQQQQLTPAAGSSPPANHLFSEIVCSTHDDVSTLGEPQGMDPHHHFRSDESTASVPMSYIRNMMMTSKSGFAHTNHHHGEDAVSRAEASRTTTTEFDPDKSILPPQDDDDDAESLDELFQSLH